MFLDIAGIGLALLVLLHEIQGGQQDGIHPLLLQVGVHHPGGEHLAARHEFLLGSIGKDFLPQRLNIGENGTHIVTGRIRTFRRCIQFRDMSQVFLFEPAGGVYRAVPVSFFIVRGNFQQRICRTGHRRQDHDISFFPGDETGHILHPLGGADGGSTEFHDFHGCKDKKLSLSLEDYGNYSAIRRLRQTAVASLQ